jgi:signal transduction histidine kinase/response regulator of citrate/malate metabolism
MNRRILIVDDNPGIQSEFRRLLASSADAVSAFTPAAAGSAAASARLVQVPDLLLSKDSPDEYDLTFAACGDEAIAQVQQAIDRSQPFAAAFVDLRMPPGIDGVQTSAALWRIDPELQVVLCTGHEDYNWPQLVAKLGRTERLLILEKPFHALEVRQLAQSLTSRWNATQRQRVEQETKDRQLSQRLEELTRARQAIERADAAKGVFLAHMSHELRTPMTAIMGYCDLLLDPEQTDEDRAQSIRTIRRNSDQLLSLINDLMDLSKIDAGTLSIVLIDCSPSQVLREVTVALEQRAAHQGITLDVACEGSVPETIRTDPARLRQILGNVLTNAIRFSHGTRLSVRMRLLEPQAAGAEGAPDRTRTSLQVEFSEPSIASVLAQQSEAIGSNRLRARRFGGTGLGLALAKRLAEMLGGDVEVQTSGGHALRVTIDAGTVQRPMHPQCAVSQSHPQTTNADTAPLHGRVLVAEDGADNQRLIRRFLERMGMQVTTVENGRLALERVTRDREAFDVIVLDIHMPEMDGMETTTRLRAAGITKPIVALTADAGEGERERCIAGGFDDYLSKPIDRDIFAAVIRKHLQPKLVPNVTTKTPSTTELQRQIDELTELCNTAASGTPASGAIDKPTL